MYLQHCMFIVSSNVLVTSFLMTHHSLFTLHSSTFCLMIMLFTALSSSNSRKAASSA